MFYLTLATVLVAVFVISKGARTLWGGDKFWAWSHAVLYNRAVGIVVWCTALAWSLWEVTKLGPADFGSFKGPLFVVFLALGVSSIWMLKDYLFVRGAAILMLLVSWWLLKAAYLQPQWTRIIFVIVVYAIIIASLYFTVAPWRMRDVIVSLEKNKHLRKIVGGWYLLLGIILLGVAVSYQIV